MKRLTILVAVLLGSAAIAFAQTDEKGAGILKAEAIGSTDIVNLTFDDGSQELYRRVDRHVGDTPVFSYRYCKGRYDTAGYVRSGLDPYDPFDAGLLACLGPGLGHVYDGEVLRGLAFLTGTYCCFCLGGALLSPVQYMEGRYDPQYGYYEESVIRSSDSSLGSLLILGGVAIWIWNICDAVKVAKVKDLYFRDLIGQRSSLDARLLPELSFAPGTGKPTAGLSLRLSF